MNFSILNNTTPSSFDILKANTITTSNTIIASTINSNAFLSPFQFQAFPQNTADTTITGLSGTGKWVDISATNITKIEKTQKISLIPLKDNPPPPNNIRYGFFGGVLAPNGIIYGMPYVHNYVLQIRTGLPTLQPLMLEAYFNKF